MCDFECLTFIERIGTKSDILTGKMKFDVLLKC